MVKIVRVSPRTRRAGLCVWNQVAIPEVRRRAAIAPVRGQGLGSTMWNAWAWWVMKPYASSRREVDHISKWLSGRASMTTGMKLWLAPQISEH